MLLILVMFSIYSSDKNKCYEMIKKLSDIYQSDKEYLMVCILEARAVSEKKQHFFVFFSHI